MSRCLLVIVLALVSSSYPVAGQTSSEYELLQHGAELYENNRFTAALEVYEEALTEYGASGPLLYNIGNAYFRTDQVGQAIRYYEKAARHMPAHQMIEHNLDVARSRIEQPIPSIPVPFWQRWWNYIMRTLTPSGLMLIGLGTYLPVMGLLGYRLWQGGLPTSLRLSMWILTVAAIVGIGGGLLGSWFESIDRRTVVLSPETSLYSDPATNSTITREIPEGTILSVDENLPDWQNVRLPNGATGWVKREDTGDI